MRGAVFETALRMERGCAIAFDDFYKNSPKRVGEILTKIGDFSPERISGTSEKGCRSR